jgi:hypothetical protein
LQRRWSLECTDYVYRVWWGTNTDERHNHNSSRGYLGQYSPVLKVGDTQILVHNGTTDSGPWYLTPEQKELQRYDQPTGRSKDVEQSKTQLLACLNHKKVTLQQQHGFTRKDLQELAQNNWIEITKQREVINPGWQDKPKGLLQVLWERGLINSVELDKYTVDRQKIVITGKVDLQYSLCQILANCRDFKEEETALQHLGRQARAYICTYHHLEQKNLQNKAADAIAVDENSKSDAAPAGALKQELLYSEIERLMKAFKGHRCALNFNRGFVNSKLKEATGKKDDYKKTDFYDTHSE